MDYKDQYRIEREIVAMYQPQYVVKKTPQRQKSYDEKAQDYIARMKAQDKIDKYKARKEAWDNGDTISGIILFVLLGIPALTALSFLLLSPVYMLGKELFKLFI